MLARNVAASSIITSCVEVTKGRRVRVYPIQRYFTVDELICEKKTSYMYNNGTRIDWSEIASVWYVVDIVSIELQKEAAPHNKVDPELWHPWHKISSHFWPKNTIIEKLYAKQKHASTLTYKLIVYKYWQTAWSIMFRLKSIKEQRDRQSARNRLDSIKDKEKDGSGYGAEAPVDEEFILRRSSTRRVSKTCLFICINYCSKPWLYPIQAKLTSHITNFCWTLEEKKRRCTNAAGEVYTNQVICYLFGLTRTWRS